MGVLAWYAGSTPGVGRPYAKMGALHVRRDVLPSALLQILYDDFLLSSNIAASVG